MTGGAEKTAADCARRSPDCAPEDAGSIPATSTLDHASDLRKHIRDRIGECVENLQCRMTTNLLALVHVEVGRSLGDDPSYFCTVRDTWDVETTLPLAVTVQEKTYLPRLAGGRLLRLAVRVA